MSTTNIISNDDEIIDYQQAKFEVPQIKTTYVVEEEDDDNNGDEEGEGEFVEKFERIEMQPLKARSEMCTKWAEVCVSPRLVVSTGLFKNSSNMSLLRSGGVNSATSLNSRKGANDFEIIMNDEQLSEFREIVDKAFARNTVLKYIFSRREGRFHFLF